MKLSRLVASFGPSSIGRFDDGEISSIVIDSRKVAPGALFVAVAGAQKDGHRFVEEAVRRGAAALVVEQEVRLSLPAGFPVMRVESTRAVVGKLAAEFYGNPSQRLWMVGVTGTSGKTTTTYLIRKILKEAGRSAGLLGTVEYDLVGRRVEATRTTPGPIALQRFLAELAASGGEAAAMEVSSHALDQGRVRGVDFDAALFTNLTQDHLDYHGDMENYFDAKKRLFLEELPSSAKGKKWSAVNTNDPYGKRLWQELKGTRLSFGIDGKADLRATKLRTDFHGTFFHLESPFGSCDVETNLIGRHNVFNLLAAAAAVAPLGLGWNVFARAVKEVSVPGRLEPLFTKKGCVVFVDYAHCDDALEKVLTALRPLTEGKLIVVFGCGGDRDKGKREKMGRVAGKLADHLIVTSDNPRSEEPQEIIAAIMRGAEGGRAVCETEVDREKAINLALRRAKARDVVLIAGKGHEKEQIFRDRVIPFDDKKVAEFYAQVVV